MEDDENTREKMFDNFIDALGYTDEFLSKFPKPDYRGVMGDYVILAPNGMWCIFKSEDSYFLNDIGLCSELELLQYLVSEDKGVPPKWREGMLSQYNDIKKGKHLEKDQTLLMTWELALEEIHVHYGQDLLDQVLEIMETIKNGNKSLDD